MSNFPMWIGNRGCPCANVDRGCPGLHLLKWPVAGAWCDVSDHLLLFFTVRTSWRVHAVKVNGCSRKTVASMLSDSLNVLVFDFIGGTSSSDTSLVKV
ncbi:hypothetical protein CDL15_Pgr005101 [Punica granatum]|uniref:Uncharacterized protein n=1 Tax=Punica granatum TaxID=22663 RepID=A0A218WRC9_PUNGR|nr:hypothetical protein CDL15_Pgr005101 [Punica granatum]